MFHLFSRKSSKVNDRAIESSAVRNDGLTPARAKLVCQFQASVESAGNVDYEALSISLKSARMMDKPCNEFTLRQRYNEAVQAGAYGLARNSRASG